MNLLMWCASTGRLGRVPGPMPLHSHHVEGYALQEVLQGRLDPDAVPLQRIEAGCASGLVDPLEEFGLGEGIACVFGTISE